MLKTNYFSIYIKWSNSLIKSKIWLKFKKGSKISQQSRILFSLQNRQVLLVQTLFAEIEEFQLSGEVLSDYFLGCLLHLWFVDVPVDLGEYVHLSWKLQD